MTTLVCPLLWIAFLAEPVPKFPLGKDTTCITGPLDAEGYVDYETALNGRLRAKIKPENNAAVLLMKALGPKPDRSELPPRFFEWLQVDPPPERGDYFIDLYAYLKRDPFLKAEERDRIITEQGQARRSPWAEADHPPIVAWLKANEKPLAMAIEASRRRDYFLPAVSKNGGAGGLLGARTMSVLSGSRGVVGALTTRAMLRSSYGQLDDAWQDLIACHRLARLTGRGATIIEALMALALEGITVEAEIAWLQDPRLTAKQIQQSMRDIGSLSPLPVIHEKADLGDRFLFLDLLQVLHRKNFEFLGSLGADVDAKNIDPKLRKAWETIDWGTALRQGNRRQDTLVAVLQIKNRVKREKLLGRLAARTKWPPDADPIVELLKKNSPEREVGEAIVDFARNGTDGAVHKMQQSADRAEQTQRNLRVAFALAAYHAEHHAYPDKLRALTPKYLAEIPDDLFSGQALIYRRAGTGYILYSVGANGRDDGGRRWNDDPPGDDLVIRVPLPDSKQK